MKIGVTGGIGSGKSLVVNELEKLGAVVYRADNRAKELVYLPEIKSQIIQLLGESAFVDNQYNTRYVASRVFADDELLAKMNAIIHPAVFKDLDAFCQIHQGKTIVYESALMIETNHTHLFDKIILVTAPIELKVERVILRDHTDRMSVLQRMEKQWTDDKKKPFAHFIIENIEKEDTIKKVHEIWFQLFQ